MIPTNADKAEMAYQAVDGYGGSESLEECVTDILADLMHLCDVEEMSFSQLFDRAFDHYNEEKREEVEK